MSYHIVDLGSDEDEDVTTEVSEETSDMMETVLSDNYSEVETDADFKEQLKWCLNDVQHEGSFSAFRHHKLYPNPGLRVQGLGFVGLPLSGRDAKAVAALCNQSPFGRRDETIVDEEVRKSWELDASQLECRNPEWATFERTVANQAVIDLGVKASARAQLYKFLLYEEGAFFKPHRDTEKVPGMFGTMVICLPSDHTGGEVHLSLGNNRQVLQTAATSAYDISTLAWYSDVQHEIKPVLSGYRLVLTYNLVQDQAAPRQTAAAQEANHETLERLLRAWNRNFDHRDHFVYPLSFKYTENSLCQSTLKGGDAAKGRYLDQVCAREGVYWFLAHMIKQREEDDYYGYSNSGAENDEHVFRWFCLPDGRSINLGGMYSVETDALLADEDSLYGDRDPDSEDEGEYTGNENMPATHRYHDTVIVLMRKDDVFSSLKLASSHSPDSLLAHLSLFSADTQHQSEALTLILEKAIEYLSGTDNDASYSKSYVLTYGKDEELKRAEYAKAFETIADFCYSSGLGDVVSRIIRALIKGNSWTTSKNLVGLVARQLVMEGSSGESDVWEDWLSTSLPLPCTYTFAREQEITYNIIRTKLPTTSLPAFDEWKRCRIEKIIQNVQSYCKEDAQPIVDLIPAVSVQLYLQSIVPTLIDCPDASGISRLLCLLAVNDTISHEQITKPTYEQLAETATAVLKLPIASIATAPRYPYDQNSEKSPAQELLEIIECYLKLGLVEEGAQLLQAGLPDVPDIASDLWRNWRMMFSFLGSLVDLISQNQDQRLREPVTQFIQSVLRTAGAHFAQRRPSSSPNWVMTVASRVGTSEKCNCAPCKTLEAFLANPKERIGKFRYNEQIRKHLRYKLDSMDFKFDTERGRSPYALVITKTQNRHVRETQEWKTTICALRTEIQDLIASLKPLGIRTNMADLDARFVEEGASEAVLQADQPIQPTSSSLQNAPARKKFSGMKRKSDVIDLTED